MEKEMNLLKNPKSRAAEAYRTLRTNLQFSSVDEPIKAIVVTSSLPGEGKSTIVSNLAIVLAQSGIKVLLIDCDLRKPAIHEKFGISNDEGLTSILSGEKKMVECVKMIDLPNLHIITSGPIPPDPAELLGSRRMKNFIKFLKGKFEMVIIDSPPVLAVTDPQILASICDGVVFVASYGEAGKKDVVKARELIEKVGAKILGVIFNKVPDESKNYNSYYE